MKKFVLLALAASIVSPAVSFAQTNLKIGTVDMQRAFKEYNKTKDAEAKVNDAKNAAKKEFEERSDSYKKALDEINKLNQQLDSPALSSEAKGKLSKERDDKIASLKSLEREINEFRQTREQQLQAQAMRMRESIVQEITEVVVERVKTNGMDLVFDKSGQSTNYVPVVLFSRDSADFTADIITALNKKAANAVEKPASGSGTPGTSEKKAGATPAKQPPKP
jgi:outer membrane protein